MSDEPGTPHERPHDPDSASAESGSAFGAHVRAARSELENQVAHARAEFEEANERIKERTGRDLILAILIGLAIGVVVLASLLFVKWTFVIFATAVAALGVFEFCRALQASGRRIDVIPHAVLAAAMVASAYFVDVWVLAVLLLADIALLIVWRLVAQMMAQDGRAYSDVLADVLIAGFVQIYVPFLASLAMILLRQDGGEWWVVAFLAVAVASDTGAYATGLTFGRHPMAPRVSPKKTWEGFAGAVVAALIAGVLFAWLALGLPAWAGLIIGAVIVVTATIGDLGESMLKRDLGIKDMSSWLPGHGGVLDRLDSILPSAPAMLALFLLLSPLGVS